MFSKEVERYCINCEYAKPICDDDKILCEKKKNIYNEYNTCRKFSFDPFKIKPKLTRD